jgi:hypothetical protein
MVVSRDESQVMSSTNSNLAFSLERNLLTERTTAETARAFLLAESRRFRTALREIENEPVTQAVMKWLETKGMAFSLQPGRRGEYFHQYVTNDTDALRTDESNSSQKTKSLARVTAQSSLGRFADWFQNVRYRVLELTPSGIQISRYDTFHRVTPSARLSLENLSQIVAQGATAESTRKLIDDLAQLINSDSVWKEDMAHRLWSLREKAGTFGLIGDEVRPGFID